MLFIIGCSTGRDTAHDGGPKPNQAPSDAAADAAASEARLPTTPPEADGGSVATAEDASVMAPLPTAGQGGSASNTPAAGSGGTGTAGSDSTGAAGSGVAGAAGRNSAGTGGVEATPSGQGIKASDEVFRDDLLRSYELTFIDADWKKLQDTATEEIYVPATLRVEGEMIGKIGVRYKGAYGTLQGCFDNGKQTCRKLSMKLKFDEYDPSLRYRGLKKLNLHSSLNDHSHLHERVSYKLFREFGVLAPRSAHARLLINGEYKGLYNLTEEVDGRFTDYRFTGEEGQGTLYKEAWPGTSQDAGYYTNAQQTNEGASVSKIVQFAQALADAPKDELGKVVERWMDPDATLRYLAVHTATKHWDGPLTFYCTPEYGCNNHNYFLFESVAHNQFSMVAWDTDNTFYENVLTDEAKVPEWYEAPGDCKRDGEFLAPGCDRLVQGFVQLGLDKFRASMGKLLEGPYNVSALQADVDRWAAQIDKSVKTDPAGSGYEDWRGNVDYLKSMIADRYAQAKAIRDAR